MDHPRIRLIISQDETTSCRQHPLTTIHSPLFQEWQIEISIVVKTVSIIHTWTKEIIKTAFPIELLFDRSATMKGVHAYTDSPSIEDHQNEEPLLNSDDISTSTHDEEKWLKPKSWRLRRPEMGFIVDIRDYGWLIVASLLFIIVGLQLVIWHDIKTQACDSSVQVGGDYNRKGPTCSSPCLLTPFRIEQVPRRVHIANETQSRRRS